MEEYLIQFHNITKEYISGEETLTALDHISLSINKGEFVSLVGESGSGKSTCMNIMGCLDIPTSGEYIFRGRNIKSFSKNDLATIRNKHIGFVFQQYNLLSRHTVIENVETPLLYSGLKRAERKARSMRALELVGLADKANNLPNQLSGGQQQRISIARAIVNKPDLILADEPTGALDTKTANEIMGLFCELNNQGNTIVLITHNTELAYRGKRIVELCDGKIIAERTL